MSNILRKSSIERYSRSRSSQKIRATSGSLLSQISRRQFQKISEDEEKELIVYSIREEIIARAMDEIYNRYLENQSVKFLVHCTHRALNLMISQYFYVHQDNISYIDHPRWSPEAEPHCSPPDTWAAKNVPIATKEVEDDVEEEEEEELSLEDEESRMIMVSRRSTPILDDSNRMLDEELVRSEEETVENLTEKLEAEVAFQLPITDTSSEKKTEEQFDNGNFVGKEDLSASVQSMFSKTTQARKESLMPLQEFGLIGAKPSFPLPKLSPLPVLPWKSEAISRSSLIGPGALPGRAVAKFVPSSRKKKTAETKNETKE